MASHSFTFPFAHFPSSWAQGGDSAAQPGPCRKTPCALYVEVGRSAGGFRSGIPFLSAATTDTVADLVLRRPPDRCAGHVFAYPGDGINGLVAAFGRGDDRPRFIRSRHEGMSALEPSATRRSASEYLVDVVVPGQPPNALGRDVRTAEAALRAVLPLSRREEDRSWREACADPRRVVCVQHDNDVDQVTRELRSTGGAPKFERSPGADRGRPGRVGRGPARGGHRGSGVPARVTGGHGEHRLLPLQRGARSA